MKKWFLGAAGMVLLLSFPQAAADGARTALAQWYRVVAPALFPFMALMPLLTAPEAMTVYEALLGGLMGRAFRLPGAAASALAVGMLAGSPAGCIAARRAAEGMSRGQLERLAVACCGLSPAFLISGVGAGMLGSAALGHLLLRSQILTQILLLLPSLPDDGVPLSIQDRSFREEAPLRGAVLAILSVAGYMALFSALAGALGQWLGRRAGGIALCALDVTSGARIIAGMTIPETQRLVLLSALLGFGGVCICAQNLSALSGCGVRMPLFIAGRLIAAGISALMTWLQCRMPQINMLFFEPNTLQAACLCAILLAFPGIFQLYKQLFNNKNSAGTAPENG